MKGKDYSVLIECTDKADALALEIRIKKYLETLDNGDYCGREIKIMRL